MPRVDRPHDLGGHELLRVAARQAVGRACGSTRARASPCCRSSALTAGERTPPPARSMLPRADRPPCTQAAGGPPAGCRRGRARDRRARRAGCWSAAARRRGRWRIAATADPRSRRSRGRSARPRTRHECSTRTDRRTSRSGATPRSISTPSISASNASRGRLNCGTSGAQRAALACLRACRRRTRRPARARHRATSVRRAASALDSPASSTASSTARQKSQTATIARALVRRQDEERVVEIRVASHQCSACPASAEPSGLTSRVTSSTRSGASAHRVRTVVEHVEAGPLELVEDAACRRAM